MNMRFAVVAFLALTAAGSASAVVILPPPLPPTVMNFKYDLTLPTITIIDEVATENVLKSFDFEFSWLGPLKFDAGPDTSCPIGCPVDGTTPGTPADGFFYSGIAFTASTSGDCAVAPPAHGCAEVLLSFSDSLGDDITYTLIEPDAFWSGGGSSPFAPGDGIGSGASWTYTPASVTTIAGDPPCISCSVTISESVAAPEPGTIWLLAGAGLVGLVAKRNFARIRP